MKKHESFIINSWCLGYLLSTFVPDWIYLTIVSNKFFIHLKNQLLASLIFVLLPQFLNHWYLLWFFHFFSSVMFWFICFSFSRHLRCTFRWLILYFYFSLCRLVMIWISCVPLILTTYFFIIISLRNFFFLLDFHFDLVIIWRHII